ncbi:MAG: YbaY family lipoprotein [Anaerolineales bacterium]|nr:YbaY family lipoprotein [Anaerolineales bacterium]
MRKTIIVLTALGLTLAACAQAAPAARISGHVTYLQRIALPDDAVVTVQLVDVSLADAPAVVLGEQVIHPAGQQVPIPFTIHYDPAAIQSNMSYALRATIHTAEDELWFINTSAHLVLTRGYPSDNVELLLEMVRQ